MVQGLSVTNDRSDSSEQAMFVVDSYLSPDDCRAKALDCLIKADASDDPQDRIAMLKYAEWWNRLAEFAQKLQENNCTS